MKVLGLPIQFLVVALASAALFIYLLAAVADARVEVRTKNQYDTSRLAMLGQGDGPFGFVSSESAASAVDSESGEFEKKGWESAFLFVCPFH